MGRVPGIGTETGDGTGRWGRGEKRRKLILGREVGRLRPVNGSPRRVNANSWSAAFITTVVQETWHGFMEAATGSKSWESMHRA